MKRILCLLLALLCVLTLAACSVEELESALNEAGSYGSESAQAPSGTAATAAPSEAAPSTAEPAQQSAESPEPTAETVPTLDENGSYSSKEDVALYLHLYGHLPSNYITKKQAEKLGWTGGSLEPYAPGCAIGGTYFSNYEGLLPEAPGRSYTECDIDTVGRSSRGAKRIVFSNDGLIYYTDDHYESFTLLYGEVDG